MDTSVIINLGILVVAGLAALLAWVQAGRAGKAQREANAAASTSAEAAQQIANLEKSREEQRARDAVRAHLTATLAIEDVNRAPVTEREAVLSICNSGQVKAMNVEVLVHSKHVDLWGDFDPKIGSNPLIGPGGCLQLRFDPEVKALTRPLRVRLNWTDQSGHPRWWESDVS